MLQGKQVWMKLLLMETLAGRILAHPAAGPAHNYNNNNY